MNKEELQIYCETKINKGDFKIEFTFFIDEK